MKLKLYVDDLKITVPKLYAFLYKVAFLKRDTKKRSEDPDKNLSLFGTFQQQIADKMGKKKNYPCLGKHGKIIGKVQ